MHTGKLLFAQLMEHLPPMVFERCVARYGGHHKVKSFSCSDQFLCMVFAQLTFREAFGPAAWTRSSPCSGEISKRLGFELSSQKR